MGNIVWFTILNAILLFARIPSIHTEDYYPLGRLISPEEGCGISKVSNTKIVGGTEAKPGAFPWMVTVGYNDAEGSSYFRCGGSLITSRHVLTAAHCVLEPRKYIVGLGEHDIRKAGGLFLDVIRVDAHPNFTSVDQHGDGLNDIAVLTLQFDVHFNNRVRPICLPTAEELKNSTFLNTNPFVAGWGQLQKIGKKSKVLMQVQIPVIDNAKCKHLYKKKFLWIVRFFLTFRFTNAAICAGNLDGGQDACTGDSGGPLMLPILQNGKFPMYQIGIVAWGIGCGAKNTPGVYTRVSHYIDWIQEKINQK